MFCKFIIHQLISLKLLILVISSPIKVLEKGILPLEPHSVAIQFFLDLENDDKLECCYLHNQANRCCVYDIGEIDCESMKLIGKHDDVLKPKDRKTYLFFYVTMFQLNHEGYCTFDLVHRCGRTSSKNEEIRIPFDTRLQKKQTQHLLQNFILEKISKCKSVDEDPLNKCRPVNCDFKYAGTKPFFNNDTRRCIEAVKCFANPFKSLPNVVYEPASNTCKDLDHSLSVSDIYAINSGLGIIVTPNKTDVREADETNIIVYKPNCSTISQNALFLKDMISGKLKVPVKGYYVDYQTPCHNAFISILARIFGISLAIVLFVCSANVGLIMNKEWNNSRMYKKVDQRDYEEFSGENRGSVNKEVTNMLLKEVRVSELPLELRDSVVDICERIGKEVRWKKRYRMLDDGSNINLKPAESCDTSTTSDLDVSEKAKILK